VILAEDAPENIDVVYALGLLNLQANRVDDAEKNFTQLLAAGERRDDAYYYLGQIAESRQQSDAALDQYRLMESGTNYFHAQLRIALIMSAQGKVDEARKHLGDVSAENAAQEKQLIQAEGEILTENERYDDAMSVYDAALVDTYDSDLLYTRAMLAEKIDRIDILENDLRAIIEREPENAQALNALGYTLANRTERYQEALELITRALEISPDDFYILDSMGWVLYRLGRLEDSVPYLERAREIRNDPEVAAHLGEVLWVMGDKDGARDVWDSALRDRPDDRILLDVIERLKP
jgi:tetratricopeptide (TPR) repeat protein